LEKRKGEREREIDCFPEKVKRLFSEFKHFLREELKDADLRRFHIT
jgi:hypothetical protein